MQRTAASRINRSVVGMTITRFLSDACHEMVTAVLPGFRIPVLKQDATRHHLWTNAERQAALSGLMRLVGRRNTVAPWRTE